MVSRVHHAAAAGRQHARRLFLPAVLIAFAGAVMFADPARVQRIGVSEAAGVYSVAASFAVSEPPQTVIAVLTDYDRIPKYMPDVEISRVIERTPTGAVIEQQAVSHF